MMVRPVEIQAHNKSRWAVRPGSRQTPLRKTIKNKEFTVLEVSMKKVIVLIVFAVSLVSMPLIVAGHGNGKDKKGERVSCCHGKGKCDNLHGKADCEKEGGKVVKSCKECK
jgi:hypothetical protein